MSIVPAVAAKLGEALTALKKHLENEKLKSQKETMLVDHEAADSVTLRFRLKTAGTKNAIRFQYVKIPHSLFEGMEACVLVRDPKERATKAVEGLNTKNKTVVKKVLAIKSLKKKYKSAEMRRTLANRFGLFMAEEAVLEMMPDLLGRYFYDVKKAKIPCPIEQISDAEVSRVLSSTRFRLSTGPVVGVKVGRLENMEISQIIDNAKAVVEAFEKFIAKKNTIVAVEIQVTDSLALPLYQIVKAEATAVVATAEKSGKKATKRQKPAVESEESDGENIVKSLASVSVKNLKKKLKTK